MAVPCGGTLSKTHRQHNGVYLKIVAFVPAKSESNRVANKNLAILDGEHLFKRKIRHLLDVPQIDTVYLDTDSDVIANRAADLPVERIVRPAELATNATDGHELFAFQCLTVPDADIYIQALCTAPFLNADTIQRALEALLADPEATSLVAVRNVKQYQWHEGQPSYGVGRIPNSVDLQERIVESMSLYMVKRKPGDPPPTRRFTANTLLFPLSPREELDVNYPEDLVLAEDICAGERARTNQRLKLIGMNLSSPVLADIIKEMRIDGVLAPRVRHIAGRKIIGLAKTLQLTALPPEGRERKTDAWRGIYNALDSYSFIRPGDVIMVSTDIPDKAYFGDLNAHLAIRAGAVGAIIDGFTRDTAYVKSLDFSVFAQGAYCDDIKYEGTVESMNVAVDMGGVSVSNDDFVFADTDGVVVIPRRHWPDVEKAAWEALHKEAQIRLSVLQGRPIDQILDRHGIF